MMRYYTVLCHSEILHHPHHDEILHHPPPQWDTAPPPQWWDTAPSSTIMGYYTTSMDTVWKNKQESPSVSKGMEASQPQPAACGHMTLCSHYYKYLAIHCQNTVQEWNRERILSACVKTPRKQDPKTSISSKHRAVLEMCFCAPPRCSRQERCFSCRYSCASVEKHISASCGLSLWLNLTHVILLHPQSINCLMLWVKAATAWDFTPPHLLAPFSQVPTTIRAANNSSISNHEPATESYHSVFTQEKEQHISSHKDFCVHPHNGMWQWISWHMLQHGWT